MSKNFLIPLALFAIIICLQLVRIDQRTRLDENIWVETGVKFAHLFSQGKLNETRLSTRPGMTVMIPSGITTLTERLITHRSDIFSLQITRTDFLTNRIVFGILISLLSICIYLPLSKLIGEQKSALLVLLLSSNSLIIDSLSSVWTDIFLAFFCLLSLIFYLLHLEKPRRYFLIASGISFGLALATKSIAAFLPVALLTATFLTNISKKNLIYSLKSVFVVSLVGIITLLAVFPYLWVEPLGILSRYQELADGLGNGLNTGSFGHFPLLYYPLEMIFDNLFVVLGTLLVIVLVIYRAVKREKIPPVIFFPLVAFVFYSFPLIGISQVKYLSGKPGQNIVDFRYLLPGLFFLYLFIVEGSFYFVKKGFRYLIVLPFVTLLLYFYNLIFLILNSY